MAHKLDTSKNRYRLPGIGDSIPAMAGEWDDGELDGIKHRTLSESDG